MFLSANKTTSTSSSISVPLKIKENKNKVRTCLLLLVDKELKSKNNSLQINSNSETKIKEKYNEELIVEIHENYCSKSPTNVKYFQESKNKSQNNLITLHKDKFHQIEKKHKLADDNTSNSDVSLQSTTKSSTFLSISDNSNLSNEDSSKKFISSLSLKINLIENIDKNNKFLKCKSELKKDLTISSFKKLKSLVSNLKSSKPLILRKNIKHSTVQSNISLLNFEKNHSLNTVCNKENTSSNLSYIISFV